MERLENAWGPWVLRHRWWLILATLVLIPLAASGGRFLTFTTNYRVFFSADNPQLLAFEKLENTYTKNDNVMFVLAPADGDAFSRTTLAAVEALTKKAWQIPYSIRVDSVSNFQHTYADGDELVVRDLVTDAPTLSDEDLQRIRSIALNEPLLAKRLMSARGDVTGVNVTVQLPGKDSSSENPEVVAYARRLADEVRQAYPEIEVRLIGMVMMNHAFTEASQDDIQTLVPLSFAVMLTCLALLLRSLTSTLATLLVIGFSIVTAMGLGGYLGLPLTPPSASAPTIILTVAVANSVHILVTFLHGMRGGMAKEEALTESLRINLQPVLLTSLTTALGFLSMNFSEVPPFRHLGNLVAMGVTASFFLAVTFLPAVMSLLPVRVRTVQNGPDVLMAGFAEFVVRRRRPLLWGMTIFIVTLIAFVPRNELNDIFVHYFDKDIVFRQDVDFATERLTGMYQIEYSLESGAPGGISDPGFLQDAAAFAAWYRQQPEVEHVNTLTDTLLRLNKNLHGDDPAWYRLPDERNLAAQYLLLYEMSLPYGLDLNNQINVDKSAMRVTVTTKTLSSNDMLALEQRAQAWLANHATHIGHADGSGTILMFAHIGKRNILSMLLGTTVALMLISLLLVIAFRSVKIGLISMVPNLVPAAMGFGLWGMLVGEVGLALSVVAGMTLGIVVDDTVHYLSKYLRARREKGLGPADAVGYAFTSVGRALLVTSIVLITGFLILALSSFQLNAGMGLLTAIVIALALAADFLLLPPLLMKTEETRNEKMVASVPGTGPASP